MAGVSGAVGRTGDAGPQGPIGQTGAQGPIAGKSGWNSHADYTFGTNSNEILRADRNKARDVATYMERNPSQRIALDSSSTSRVGVARAALIDAGLPVDRIQSGGYGDPQLRRDGRVEVLVGN
jgi:outer membrane protein OmpA-like peptidoglycan-associated protein